MIAANDSVMKDAEIAEMKSALSDKDDRIRELEALLKSQNS